MTFNSAEHLQGMATLKWPFRLEEDSIYLNSLEKQVVLLTSDGSIIKSHDSGIALTMRESKTFYINKVVAYLQMKKKA